MKIFTVEIVLFERFALGYLKMGLIVQSCIEGIDSTLIQKLGRCLFFCFLCFMFNV